MSLRVARCTGTVLFALLALATFGVSLLTSPSRAAGAVGNQGAPAFTLLDQSPWVLPGQSFHLEVAAPAGTPRSATVEVTVFNKLTSHSGFEATIGATPQSGILDHTDPVALSDLARGQDGGSELTVGIGTSSNSTPGGTAVDLSCAEETDACAGVYPVVVTLAHSQGGSLGRFTTYLTYAESQSNDRLLFSWVVPVSDPVTFTPSGDPAKALAPATPSSTAALSGLATSLRTNASVPVTVEAVPETLQSLTAVTGARSAAAKSAVSTFGSLSDNQALHEFPPSPYVSIDAGALSGEQTELRAQMDEGASTAHNAGVSADTGPLTWITTGGAGTNLGSSLSYLGAQRLVLPDTDLAPLSAGQESGRTWASPFQLQLGHESILSAASDTELASHFTDDPSDPAVEVAQVLADLSLIHLEAPNLDRARGIVVVPPVGWTPNTTFDNELLAGLSGQNPNIQAATLGDFFSNVPPPAPGDTRRLATGGTGPSLAPTQAARLSAGRLRLTGFTSALPADTPVLSQLDNVLLASQSDTLAAHQQSGAVANFERLLGGQLSLIDLSNNRTITLTARTGAIPITLISNAPYTVTGTLVVSSTKFVFLPPGPVRPGVVLNHPTTPVRIEAVARTSGDLPLQATFVSPDHRLVIARAELTVRSTATSAVGIILTVLALLVLMVWWARTWRGGRRAKRAAKATP